MNYLLEALQTMFQPSFFIPCLLCSILGIILGALPGLGGGLAIAIILPLSFGMDSNLAIAMLMSVWIGSCSGGFIGSILLGIPGTPASLSTCYDGYPLTLKGEATHALSVGIVANFIGTFPSILIAMFACPTLARLAIKMGAWEYFALTAMAFTLVIGLSKGKMFKGFIACGLGLFMRCVGLAPVSSQERFTGGSLFLMGGFNQLCLIIGLFAGSLILMNYAKGDEGNADAVKDIGKFKLDMKAFLSNITNVIRSFLIGLGIGILPGMGASLSNVVAYATAKNSSAHPEEFGTGKIDGVIAPEVANNAGIGGAIIPMIALGIPGDGTTALLLGGLMIHGIDAGPMLQIQHPQFVYYIFTAALVGAIVTLVLEIAGIRYFPRILKVPYHFLYPTILVFAFIGAYTNVYNMWGIFQCLIATGIGIWFAIAGIPTTPFLLAYILGASFETNLRKAITYARGDWTTFFTRPVSCILLLIAIACILIPCIKALRTKMRGNHVEQKDYVD